MKCWEMKVSIIKKNLPVVGKVKDFSVNKLHVITDKNIMLKIKTALNNLSPLLSPTPSPYDNFLVLDFPLCLVTQQN